MGSAVETGWPAPSGPVRYGRERRRGDLGRTIARGIGQTLVTAGLVVLLFVVYEVWVTDLLTAQRQGELSDELQEQWDDPTVGDGQRQPGPTTTANLAPLCRRHHRLKTHTGWSYTVLEPGSFLWSSPQGYQFLRDHDGTADVTTTRRPGATGCLHAVGSDPDPPDDS